MHELIENSIYDNKLLKKVVNPFHQVYWQVLNSSKKGEQSYHVLNIEPSHIIHQTNTRINDYEKEHWHTGH